MSEETKTAITEETPKAIEKIDEDPRDAATDEVAPPPPPPPIMPDSPDEEQPTNRPPGQGSRRMVSQTKGNVAAGEPPITGFTEEVEPNVYHVEIKPEDWKQDLSTYVCDVEVIGMRESCICHIYPDDDRMLNNCKDRDVCNQLLKDIYGEVFGATTDMNCLHCKFIGNRPEETIYLDIEELPFFDVPASKLGV